MAANRKHIPVTLTEAWTKKKSEPQIALILMTDMMKDWPRVVRLTCSDCPTIMLIIPSAESAVRATVKQPR